MTDQVQTPADPAGKCWYQLRVIMAGGGDIELTCTRCGHTVTIVPRDGEEPPSYCPECDFGAKG